MKKFVSIIIPTYNEEKNIENTLKAIANQSYKRYEIIVSDSKSKDNTVKIARKYHAKVIIGPKKGIGAGRNLGAKHARGDILLFIDADTVMMWNTLSILMQKFSKKSVVGATCAVVPLKPTAKNLAAYGTYNKFSERSLRTQKFPVLGRLKLPIVAGICVAYRRKDFFAVGGFDEKMAAFEDLDIGRKIVKLGKIVFTYDTFVLTSPRRIEKWGYKKIFRKYVKFYIRYLMHKKIDAKEYKPIRS